MTLDHVLKTHTLFLGSMVNRSGDIMWSLKNNKIFTYKLDTYKFWNSIMISYFRVTILCVLSRQDDIKPIQHPWGMYEQ